MVLAPSYLAKLSMHPAVRAIWEQGSDAFSLLILLWLNGALGKSPDAHGLEVTVLDAIFNNNSGFQTDTTTKPHSVTESKILE